MSLTNITRQVQADHQMSSRFACCGQTGPSTSHSQLPALAHPAPCIGSHTSVCSRMGPPVIKSRQYFSVHFASIEYSAYNKLENVTLQVKSKSSVALFLFPHRSNIDLAFFRLSNFSKMNSHLAWIKWPAGTIRHWYSEFL